ncbi:MAG: vitamin K epoxide reductase family protein [Candidatus Eremiobacteraeota bacterium]|nr:vitamin K epoxide reductase family protein [Candidatus Eremiobacteraeota bacterium]
MSVPAATVTLLCVVGFYASAYMWRKARRAARGELTEPSVVFSPRARLIGGIPNAYFGVVYYPAVLIGVALGGRALVLAAFGASLAAAVTSLVLAYSLLFVTRRSCPYCWISHAVNWSLPFLLFRLLR